MLSFSGVPCSHSNTHSYLEADQYNHSLSCWPLTSSTINSSVCQDFMKVVGLSTSQCCSNKNGWSQINRLENWSYKPDVDNVFWGGHLQLKKGNKSQYIETLQYSIYHNTSILSQYRDTIISWLKYRSSIVSFTPYLVIATPIICTYYAYLLSTDISVSADKSAYIGYRPIYRYRVFSTA